MYRRHAEQSVRDALGDTRVVALLGPRQSGKTTLARQIATSRFEYLTFDDPPTRAAALADPVTFIGRLDHAVIDEFQRVSDLSLSLKRAVDEDRRPGRFIITGSSSFLSVPRATESLAGRVETIELLPLSRTEINGSKPTDFIDRAFDGGVPASATKSDMVGLVLGGGYPEALERATAARRQSWHREYMAARLARDVRDIFAVERMDRLPVLFKLLARSAGRLVIWREFGGEVGLNGKTVERYVSILEALFLVRRIRAWSGNDVQRIVSTPKLHFLDSGLLASTLGLSAQGLKLSRTALGPVLESFVYAELLKALPFTASRPRIEHYRDKDQVEVDFVLEDTRQRIVGIEVQASATVTANHFRGLRKLHHHVGDRFKCGILLHDGDRVLPFGPSLFAVPLAGLWTSG